MTKPKAPLKIPKKRNGKKYARTFQGNTEKSTFFSKNKVKKYNYYTVMNKKNILF